MCCIPPIKIFTYSHLPSCIPRRWRVQPKESETFLNLYSNVLHISTVLHIHYLMTCSEYVVLGCPTDICLVMTACGKHLRKPVSLRMVDSLLEIAVSH